MRKGRAAMWRALLRLQVVRQKIPDQPYPPTGMQLAMGCQPDWIGEGLCVGQEFDHVWKAGGDTIIHDRDAKALTLPS